MRGCWQAAAGPSPAGQSRRAGRALVFPGTQQGTLCPQVGPAPRAGCARATLCPKCFSPLSPHSQAQGLLCTLQRFQVCCPALGNHFPSSGTSESHRVTWHSVPGTVSLAQLGMQGWALLMPPLRQLEPLSQAGQDFGTQAAFFFSWIHLNTITSPSRRCLAAPLQNTFFRSPCLPNCPNIIILWR